MAGPVRTSSPSASMLASVKLQVKPAQLIDPRLLRVRGRRTVEVRGDHDRGGREDQGHAGKEAEEPELQAAAGERLGDHLEPVQERERVVHVLDHVERADQVVPVVKARA